MLGAVSAEPGDCAEEGFARRRRPAAAPGSLLRQARKLVVLVVGGTVLVAGAAMIVLPGPAVVVIPAGIAILATEFAWARRLLRRVRARIGPGPAVGPDGAGGSDRI